MSISILIGYWLSQCLYVLSFPATVQAYFRLEKPVSQLVSHIGRLEYDIYGEVGVPGTKVLLQASAVSLKVGLKQKKLT